MKSVSRAEDKRPCNESRQWRWVFRGLWSSAPRTHEGQQQQRADDADGLKTKSSHASIKTLPPHRDFRIPDTILFEQGEPRIWVGCSPEGIVVRKSFLSATSGGGDVDGSTNPSTFAYFKSTSTSSEIRHQLIAGRTACDNPTERASSLPTSSSTGGIDNLEVADRLNAIRGAFLSFAGSSHPLAPGAPVCIARYNNGSTELLSHKALDTLLGFRDWRTSLSGLQAYVHPSKTVTGTYVRQENTSEPENTLLTTSRSNPLGSSVTSSEREHSRIHSPPAPFSEITSTRSRGSTEESSMSAGQIPSAARDLDQVTRDVAFLAEMSYAWRELESTRSGDTTVAGYNGRIIGRQNNVPGDDKNGASEMVLVDEPTRSRRLPWPKSRIRVSRLEAEFTVDQSGCAWLTNVLQVLVHPARSQPKHSSSIGSKDKSRMKQKRRTGDAALAASVAARELRGLVCLARRRGLNADEIFRHFEVEGGRGRVGKREVLKGMASLGLTLSEEAATVLIEIIVSSTEAPRSKMSEVQLQSSGKTSNMRSERGDASVSDVSAVRRKRVIPNRAAQPKSLPPLREYFTSDDLWLFARIPDDVTARISGHAKDSDNEDTGEVHHAVASQSSRSDRTKASIDGKGQVQSKRRRTHQDNGEWVGGKASRERSAAEKATLTEKSPSTRTPQHHTPASLSAQNSTRRDDNGSVPMREERTKHKPPTLSTTSVSINGSCSARRINLGVTAENEKQSRPCSMSSLSGTTNCKRGCLQRGGVDPRQTFHSWASSAAEDAARTPLWAHFPCEDPVAEVTNGKDRVFHVDRYNERGVYLLVTITNSQ